MVVKVRDIFVKVENKSSLLIIFDYVFIKVGEKEYEEKVMFFDDVLKV